MNNVFSLIRADREFLSALSTLDEVLAANTPRPILVQGLSGGAEAAFLSEFIGEAKRRTPAPVLIFTAGEEARERTATVLSRAGIRALSYRPRELTLYAVSASHDVERERLFVLSEILSGRADAVVTTAPAALLYTMPREKLAALSVSLRVGETVSPDELLRKFTALGFARVDLVDGAGQFAKRGGIFDFWENAEEMPIRVEFFDDEIDRMTRFDPISQRATEPLSEVTLLPAAEVLPDAEAKARMLAEIRRQTGEATEEAKEKLGREIAAIEADLPLSFRDKYLSLIDPEKENLLSYFPGRPIVLVLGSGDVRSSVKENATRRAAQLSLLLSDGLLSRRAADYEGGEKDLDAFLSRAAAVHVNNFSGGVTGEVAGLFGFRTRRTVRYGENAGMLFEDLAANRKNGVRTLLLSPTKEGADSLLSTLADEGISAAFLDTGSALSVQNGAPGQVFVTVSDAEGFELIVPKIAVFSLAKDEGAAVMKHKRQQRILRRAGGAGEKLMSYADLSVGDYVVHESYGIGRFLGISTEAVGGVNRDYITIQYAGTDRLYVPCDRLEQVGKYIGKRDPDGEVKLSKMGGTDWNRAKSRAKSAVRDIAKDLLRLYAERQRLPGFAFPPDSELEERFAEGFEYEETASQALAIAEIKEDMQRSVPMNRLLCGDVGFGKTEVALRAAFKAIAGGKQVALLVPTTILAMQHYQTATARMRNFPVSVEMLSRFVSKKNEEKILRRVARGECDLLIGTHKLLGEAVKFRDLGLLIIDEEQRFGVAQKEKLKTLAKNVDVLTLSATPIPRTLNMAMTGINDMSILEEAPGERRPVQTYVLEHDDMVIEAALRRELARGGQTLYLYNKVEDIDVVAGRIQKAIPEARVTYAHGQMERDDIEDIWQSLVRGEIDILVCTTIIESGVDLPNANTLVIENADRFGLSQLHQIRGRVGRSSRQAYAYFTYRPGKALSEVATKRLKTIREFAEFGAGFKIALSDLEIRGAGNLLGVEQHGYIESVGYDLYVRLLSEAVLEESGKEIELPFEATVDLALDANIPERYISSSAQRMEMYKKISLIGTADDLSDVTDEFLDRFGDLPPATERLIKVALVRAIAARAKIKRVEIGKDGVTFRAEAFDLGVWSEVMTAVPGLILRAAGAPVITYRAPRGTDPLTAACDILNKYDAALAESGKADEENETDKDKTKKKGDAE